MTGTRINSNGNEYQHLASNLSVRRRLYNINYNANGNSKLVVKHIINK